MARSKVTQGAVYIPAYGGLNIQSNRVLPASNGNRNYFYCKNTGTNACRVHWNTNCTNDGGDIILAVGDVIECQEAVPQDAFNVLGVSLGPTTLAIVEGVIDTGTVNRNG